MVSVIYGLYVQKRTDGKRPEEDKQNMGGRICGWWSDESDPGLLLLQDGWDSEGISIEWLFGAITVDEKSKAVLAPGTVEVCGCTDKGNKDVQYHTVLVYDVPLQATVSEKG